MCMSIQFIYLTLAVEVSANLQGKKARSSFSGKEKEKTKGHCLGSVLPATAHLDSVTTHHGQAEGPTGMS